MRNAVKRQCAAAADPLSRRNTADRTLAERYAKLLGVPVDEVLFLHGVLNQVLLAVASGVVDVDALVRAELANRGIGRSGRWVGFSQATTEWIGSEPAPPAQAIAKSSALG